MWIFLNDAFVSVVAHKDQPRFLLVRARRRGDLERLFGDQPVVERTPTADYLYRCTVSREVLAKIIADRIQSIDYTNFKDSIQDKPLHDVCFEVWDRMSELQEGDDRRREDG